MKTPAKKRTAAELAAAVLWCALTLGTDRLFFRYDWRTPAFFVYKALFLVLAFGLVHGAVTLVQKLRAGDKFARRWVAWTLPYLAVNLVILLIVWPGIWGNDDLAVLYLARTLQPNSWQHFLTSGAFILSLMFVPMPGGVVLVQNLLISGIVGCFAATAQDLAAKRLTRPVRPAWFALVYLPFLLPPVLMHTQQPFRTTWSTWTELFLVFMLVAIYLRGMTDEETAMLTDVMAHSGDMVDLSAIAGIKADKHSTGGVGDKTTLVIAPIVAACGVKIAKMSGRGLGHTGGTIDKMESVPGTRTALSQEEFFAQVNRIGLSVIGQSEGIAIADKKMYALRDVTATVSCIPLIASSIMSKKLASGSDAILLDVTTGTGAFMKTVDQSIELAKLMVSIGTHHGRRVAAMITDMDTPLGHNIGNSLEVMESMDVLKGHGPADLTEVCLQLAANMLVLADKGTPAECRAMAEAVIADGSAFAKCKEMFAAQGGDTRVLDDYSLFEQPAASFELLAEQDGYIVANDAEKIGSASVLLGAGRQKKGDPLDFAAGITLHKKRGDYVKKGESLATFYGAADKFEAAAAEYRSGLGYGPEKPEEAPLVYALVTKDGVARY